MTQKRFVNFGTTVEAAKVKSILQNLVTPQVLVGGTFIINGTSEILVQPVSLVFENGILMEETEEKLVVQVDGANPIVQATARNYTMYYTHVDENIIGGSPATLNLTANIIGGGGFLQSVADSVILGWIQYPGGSVPLDQTMFYYPPRTQLVSYITKGTGAFSQAPWVDPGGSGGPSGPGISFGTNTGLVVAHGSDANGFFTSFTSAGIGLLDILWVFKNDFYAPKKAVVTGSLSTPGAKFRIMAFDGTTPVQFTNSLTFVEFTGVQPYQTFEGRFKTGVFVPGTTQILQVSLQHTAAGVTKIYGVGTTPYNLPF